MLDMLLSSLGQLIADPTQLGLILVAVVCGLFFGVVPGLGGKLGIVLFIPFATSLDPEAGLVFLIAMHSVVHTGGSIPSILFGVPGTGPDAATVVDGYPLAQQGQAGRALGASLCASVVGGVIGALLLVAMLPILSPIVLAFSPAEFFLLAVLGIVLISAVSGNSLRKGVIVGCFGLCLSFVGLSPQTGEPRYAFDQLFLWDGVDFVTAVLAVFAVPELIALGVRGGAISDDKDISHYRMREVLRGMGDVFRHRWLALRTSLIGAVVGLIPGLGGDVASWMCYGHAVQSAREPERFGKGAIEGVIAPETANNSKEGGALLTTLLFGLPGSSGMALLLGALVALGVQPGPQILVERPTLIWKLFIVLVLANILAGALLLVIAPRLARIARVRVGLLIPLVLSLSILGSYLSALDWQHLLVFLALGIFGYGLKYFGWPRPPFVIGLALGGIAEVSLFQALAIWGGSFFLRPVSLVLMMMIVLSILIYLWRRRSSGEGSHG
jgi:putative tricarboxylic transport membrane protein